jgi:thioredoxin-like negative regulator of GroEL
MVFQGGKATDRIVGFQPKPALKARLDALLGAAKGAA